MVDHHSMAPSFGFRFDTPDGSIVVSGDTTVSENLIELAQDADILFHEVIDPLFVQRLTAHPPTRAGRGSGGVAPAPPFRTGEADLMVRVVARDTTDLYRVTQAIQLAPGVMRSNTSIATTEVIPHRVTGLLRHIARDAGSDVTRARTHAAERKAPGPDRSPMAPTRVDL